MGSVSRVLRLLALGTLFGFVLTKSEAVSWFRIQEMFWFESFHMYGILGTAVATAAAGIWLLRHFGVRSRDGQPITLERRVMTPYGTRYWAGGTIFGFGWALTGACPGPLFALVGSGAGVMLVAIASALVGTWAYGYLRPRLPH